MNRDAQKEIGEGVDCCPDCGGARYKQVGPDVRAECWYCDGTGFASVRAYKILAGEGVKPPNYGNFYLEGIGSGVPNDEHFEFNLPDEDRFYPLAYYPCPICRSPALLWRTQGDARKPRFQVMCQRKACGHKSGWQKSSSEATRIWKVTTLLHKE